MANQKITDLSAETAPVAADLVEIVDDVAGTPTNKKVTVANLAKATAARWVSAGEFGAIAGTPAFGQVASRWAVMLFDASSTESAAASIAVPAAWTSINVDLYWTNAGAGSGNVVWRLLADRAGNTETLAASAGGGDSTNLTIAAPAQEVLKVSSLLSGQATDPTKVLNLRIIRTGGDAADTLANDAALLGVLITPA
jgi:hypothetical protein